MLMLRDLQAHLDITPTRGKSKANGDKFDERIVGRPKSLKVKLRFFDGPEFSQPDLDAIRHFSPTIRLRSLRGDEVTEHRAPNGHHFTVRDLCAAVEAHEQVTRINTEWSGGIDYSHVYFEGFERHADGVWYILWGS